MKKTSIVIVMLVLVLTIGLAFGLDRQMTALAQTTTPPIIPGGGGDTSGRLGPAGDGSPRQVYPNNQAGAGAAASPDAAIYPTGQMSYQGRLVKNGNPVNGTINITFRLYYDLTGGSAFWTETQSVSVVNGLFNVMLGKVTPLPFPNDFYYQVYLGIQPAGAAAELTPREPLSTVGYAMNLMPGATMVDTNPAGGYGYSLWVHGYNHGAIYGQSDYTDTVGVTGVAYGYGSSADGVYGYSSNAYGVEGVGDNAGVYGESDNIGVEGQATDVNGWGVFGITTLTDTIGVYGFSTGSESRGVFGFAWGYDSTGVYGSTFGDTASCPVGDTDCAAGVNAQSYGDSYGSFNYSFNRSGVIGNTSSSFYAGAFYNFNGPNAAGVYVDGELYITGDFFAGGSKAGYVVDIALNDGSEPLQQGDVVVISGYADPVLGNIPVVKVQKATSANATGVMGVVDVFYERCTKPADTLQVGEDCGGLHHDITTIQPGEYLSVVTLGSFMYIKVDASAGAIKAGDSLTTAATAGMAAKAVQISVNGVSFYAPGTIIGVAMADLDAGTGIIPVFVSPR